MESQCFSDELTISTDNDKRVSKIEIVVDLKTIVMNR